MRGENPQVYSSSAVREEREKKNYCKENEFEPNLPEYLQEIYLKIYDKSLSWISIGPRLTSMAVMIRVVLPSEGHVNVVVQFYPWFKFYFPLFCSMLMYDDKFETKENKILNQGKN